MTLFRPLRVKHIIIEDLPGLHSHVCVFIKRSPFLLSSKYCAAWNENILHFLTVPLLTTIPMLQTMFSSLNYHGENVEISSDSNDSL